MRCLISCPHCENEGRRYILGELAPTGHILIQRAHGKNGQYRNFTIIGGNDFYLICDYCGEVIYFKKVTNGTETINERREYGTMLNFGITRVLGGTFNSGFGTTFAGSN